MRAEKTAEDEGTARRKAEEMTVVLVREKVDLVVQDRMDRFEREYVTRFRFNDGLQYAGRHVASMHFAKKTEQNIIEEMAHFLARAIFHRLNHATGILIG